MRNLLKKYKKFIKNIKKIIKIIYKKIIKNRK